MDKKYLTYVNCLRNKFKSLSDIHHALVVYNNVEKRTETLIVLYNTNTKFLRVLNSDYKIVNRFLDRYDLGYYYHLYNTGIEIQLIDSINEYKIDKRNNKLEKLLSNG